jgi:hypothetical protein
MTRAVAALWLVCACRADDDPIRLRPVPESGDTAVAPSATVVDRALEAGLQDDNFGTFKRGRGCSISDLDRDGDQDLILANPADISYVMLNEGGGRFREGPVLDLSELIWAVSAADYDADGDDDLFLAVGGIEGLGLDRLLRNDLVETGSLSFTDVTVEAGVGGPIPEIGPAEPFGVASLGGAWVDFDGDADLDLYVDTTPWPNIWDEDLPADSIIGRNLLWRNDGGVFTDVAMASGLTMQGSSRYSSWLDIDNDGDLDLFENNKDTQPNVLWRNDAGQFVDVTAAWSLDGGDLSYPLETFASIAGDANQDGWDDLLVVVRGYATEGPYLLGHTLFLNAQGRGFIDATEASNLNDPFYSGFRDHLSNGVMGASLRDMNGDGLLDLFAGNGGPGSGYKNMMVFAVGLVPMELGAEAGILDVPVFEDWSPRYDFPAEEDPGNGLPYPVYPYRTHGGCIADLDGDGQVELLEMNGGMSYVGGDSVKEPNRWWHIEQEVAPRWFGLRLRGDGVTVPATPVGARVRVDWLVDGEIVSRYDTLRTSNGFSAQHGNLHFASTSAESIARVVVVWPDGVQQEVVAPTIDAWLDLER